MVCGWMVKHGELACSTVDLARTVTAESTDGFAIWHRTFDHAADDDVIHTPPSHVRQVAGIQQGGQVEGFTVGIFSISRFQPRNWRDQHSVTVTLPCRHVLRKTVAAQRLYDIWWIRLLILQMAMASHAACWPPSTLRRALPRRVVDSTWITDWAERDLALMLCALPAGLRAENSDTVKRKASVVVTGWAQRPAHSQPNEVPRP